MLYLYLDHMDYDYIQQALCMQKSSLNDGNVRMDHLE